MSFEDDFKEYLRETDLSKAAEEERKKHKHIAGEAMKRCVEWMEERGLTKIKTSFGPSCSLDYDIGSSIDEERLEEVKDWLRKTGREAALGLHWRTRNSLVAECLRNGEEIPAAIKYWTTPKLVSVRKNGYDPTE